MEDETDRSDLETRVLGSRRDPPAEREACLVVISGARLGARIVPGAEPMIIGRDVKADFQIAENSVSRKHCRIFLDQDCYWIEDLGSTNRTYVNDERVDRAPLRDGDHVRISQTILKFIDEGNIEANYHSELHEHSIRDALTGLYNRRHAMAVLETEIARAARDPEYRLGLVILDIDFFKPINDDYGHLAGDQVLKKLSEIARQRTRGGDTLARIGGEEFALILPGSSCRQAVEVADGIRQAVENAQFDLGGVPQSITLSGGAAEWSPDKSRIGDLLKAADDQLYRAKEQGRNRVYPVDSAQT